MRLYLSSFRMGDHPEYLAALVGALPSLTNTLERSRHTQWAEMCNPSGMIQDFRFAIRMLLRNPGFTLVAIAALALGAGANTSVFTVLNGVLLRPLPFNESERLQVISYAGLRGPFGPGVGLSEYFFLELEKPSTTPAAVWIAVSAN